MNCANCGRDVDDPVWAVYADEAFADKTQAHPFPLHQECFERDETVPVAHWEPVTNDELDELRTRAAELNDRVSRFGYSPLEGGEEAPAEEQAEVHRELRFANDDLARLEANGHKLVQSRALRYRKVEIDRSTEFGLQPPRYRKVDA